MVGSPGCRSPTPSSISSAARRWCGWARISDGSGAVILGKLESFNPAGSVKDRIGLSMIEAAEAVGRADPRRVRRRGAHLGQHRHRAGVRLRRQGLPLHPHDARDHERRAAHAAARLRRRAGADAGRRRHAGRDRPGRGDRLPDRRGLRPSAVPEPGQPRGPPADHRRGDLGRHRRRGRRAGGRRGHGGLDHRGRPGARRAPPRVPRDRRGAGRLARPVRRRARPPQDPGHRRRLRPRQSSTRTPTTR